jgi:hypothetical protein
LILGVCLGEGRGDSDRWGDALMSVEYPLLCSHRYHCCVLFPVYQQLTDARWTMTRTSRIVLVALPSYFARLNPKTADMIVDAQQCRFS